ncbi:MAG TPA: ThuA domain-containing protein, partial [Polyangiaceae bacterium]
MRAVAMLGFWVATAGVGACSAYTNLGDFAEAGSGGKSLGNQEPKASGGGGGSFTEHGGRAQYGGSPGASAGASAGADGNAEPLDPYAPRSGPFKMLVYSRIMAFPHTDSINEGRKLLEQIGAENDFEITITEDNDEITDAGLAAYEAVFFLNPTGDVFGAEEERAFESWMRAGGAFIGVHSATDTEKEWEFYQELTGQYYDGHGAPASPGTIVFEEDALDFPALRGLPNPWHRIEEWYFFNNSVEWEFKPGFKILGRKASDNQPILWSREWGNFRSFYT